MGAGASELQQPYTPALIHYPDDDRLEFVTTDNTYLARHVADGCAFLLDPDTREPVGFYIEQARARLPGLMEPPLATPAPPPVAVPDDVRGLERLREECARIVEGQVYHERYRTWPFWNEIPSGRPNRSEANELVTHCDKLASLIRQIDVRTLIAAQPASPSDGAGELSDDLSEGVVAAVIRKYRLACLNAGVSSPEASAARDNLYELERLCIALAARPSAPQAGTGEDPPWVVEDTGGTVWVGTARPGGRKVDHVVYWVNLFDLTEEAAQRARSHARLVVDSVNAARATPPAPAPEVAAVGLREALRQACEALAAADQFIVNGTELGFIRMPDTDTPDAAHSTPGVVANALKAVRAAIASPDQQGGTIPDGWVLLPREPTPAMRKAGDGYTNCGGACGNRAGADAYRAMLAAAPTPPSKAEA